MFPRVLLSDQSNNVRWLPGVFKLVPLDPSCLLEVDVSLENLLSPLLDVLGRLEDFHLFDGHRLLHFVSNWGRRGCNSCLVGVGVQLPVLRPTNKCEKEKKILCEYFG